MFYGLKQEFYLPQGAAFRPEQQKWPWHKGVRHENGLEPPLSLPWWPLCCAQEWRSPGIWDGTGQGSLEKERHLRQ